MAKAIGSQRVKLSMFGLAIAAGIWFGLVMVRGLSSTSIPTLEALWLDLVEECVTYVYVAGSMAAAAMTIGWLIGGKAEDLERMSMTDPLTQLANRRGFMAVLHDELQRAARYRTPLAMMILDLDYFKDVNDSCGHEAGDAALKLVADSLRGSCRATDLAARYGGDEFVVVAPSTNATEAYELANRIRQNLKVLAGERPDLGQLSLSIGIADLGCTGDCACQGEALIGAADAALYSAKQGGRDQACLAHSTARAASSHAAAVA